MEIAEIYIYPEERKNRVDIRWEREKPGRWIRFSNDLQDSIERYPTYGSHYGSKQALWYFTQDKDICLGCPNYDMIVWRNLILILPTSGIPDLIDALGMTGNCGRWISLLAENGKIPPDEKRILKKQLVEAKGKEEGEELLNRLALPFERRSGDIRSQYRPS